jgi:hypothetical protein
LAGVAVLDVQYIFGGAGDHILARDFDLPHDLVG